MSERSRPTKKADIYETYRQALGRPELTKSEIDEMRKHMIRLARAICEHVWGKKLY